MADLVAQDIFECAGLLLLLENLPIVTMDRLLISVAEVDYDGGLAGKSHRQQKTCNTLKIRVDVREEINHRHKSD